MLSSIRIAVFFFIISLSLSFSAYAQTAGWKNYSTGGKANSYGVNVTVKIPPGFGIGDKKPGVIEEFARINQLQDDVISFTYVTIAMLPAEGVTDFMRTDRGVWDDEIVIYFFENMTKQLDGIKNYKVHYFKTYPAADVIVKQQAYFPNKLIRNIDARFVIYNNVIVKLECGDISTYENISEHNQNKISICKPFFDSLQLY
jgi:hypothetical protein